MKRFILTLTLTAISSICALAQSNNDYKKLEVFAGYSYGQADAHFSPGPDIYRDRIGLNGFNGSVVFNVSRYFGIKGDISGTFKKSRFSFPTVPITGPSTGTTSLNSKNSLYNLLVGVQIKDNASEKRFKPFGHVLIGTAWRKNETDSFICLPTIACPESTRQKGLAGALGGGLDVRVNSRIDFRVLQLDYNPIRSQGSIDHNMRAGFGIVFK